jgi:hypothetical protein
MTEFRLIDETLLFRAMMNSLPAKDDLVVYREQIGDPITYVVLSVTFEFEAPRPCSGEPGAEHCACFPVVYVRVEA